MMMKNFTFFLLLIGISVNLVSAQCLSGNCKEGTGKSDLGYAVYEGSFKNGKPHGTGVIDYGGDKYSGEFADGSEHGKGILTHKNGKTENVEYSFGNLIRKSIPNYVGGIPVEGCKKGDCKKGTGEMHFPSGNRYVGNFLGGMIHGNGIFYFAGGNIFEGEMKANVIFKGKFSYHLEEVDFVGTFNEDGTPKTGLYTHHDTGATVKMQDNTITEVHNPTVEAQQNSANAKHVKCPVCNGKGITSSKTSYSYTTAGTYTMSEFGQGRINLTNPTTTTSTGRAFYDVCGRCKGAGEVSE